MTSLDAPARRLRALTMLNEAGDTTIAWGEHQDAEMREIIERKMKEGVTFFIIEPRLHGFLPSKKTALESADQAMRHRALSIPDADLAKFVSGGGQAISTPDAPVKGARRSKDADEVARSESVGVRPMREGRPMQIRLTPLPDRDQCFLDGAVDEWETTSATGIALSLYGDADRIHAIINAPDARWVNRFLRTLACRREIARRLDDYAFEILRQLPAPRRAAILGCGVAHLLKAMADLAEVCANWAHEDQTTGGAMLPYRDVWRCDDDFVPTPKADRQLRGRCWIARFVRRNDSVERLREVCQRFLSACDVMPDIAPDPSLTADLEMQLAAFRQVWAAEHAGDPDYIGAPGFDAPTMQTHEVPGLAGPALADLVVEQRVAEVRHRVDRAVLSLASVSAPALPYRLIRKRRKVTKRAAVLAAAVLGASMVSAFARGEPVVIPGQEVALRVRATGPLPALGHGKMSVAVLGADQATHLADLCVYFDKTPALDQLTAMALHMQAGLEAEVLAKANITRISSAGVGHPLLKRELADPHPRRFGHRDRQREAWRAYWLETRSLWLRAMVDVVIGNDRRAKSIMRAGVSRAEIAA